MTRKEQIFEESKIYSEYIYNQTDFENGFITGAKWADKNPNLQNIAEYLYKEKGYPISLNGEIPTFEETMKNVQTYNDYKAKQNSSELVNKHSVNVWHDASEEPKDNSNIIIVDNERELWHIEYVSDDFGDSELHGWEYCISHLNLKMWAYFDDLVPKGDRK